MLFQTRYSHRDRLVDRRRKSYCTRRVIPWHDSHARRAVTREKSPADLAARRMISCWPYVNVRHYLLAAADIQTRATLRDALSLFLHLSRTASTPKGSFLPTLLSVPLRSLPVSLFFLSVAVYLSLIALFTLAHVFFSVGLMVYYVSRLLSLLARALTFSFRLSSPLSPISQSYPRQRKMPGVSQSRERPAFSRDLWRPFAQLAAPMSRSVVNILAGPTDRWIDAPTGPRRCCLSVRSFRYLDTLKFAPRRIFIFPFSLVKNTCETRETTKCTHMMAENRIIVINSHISEYTGNIVKLDLRVICNTCIIDSTYYINTIQMRLCSYNLTIVTFEENTELNSR